MLKNRKTSEILIMALMACTGMFVSFAMLPDDAIISAHCTAFAALALLASLPLVDSVIFGSSAKAEPSGISLGLPLGFFMRQSLVFDYAQGAERVVAFAFVISVGLAGWRWMSGRRQRA